MRVYVLFCTQKLNIITCIIIELFFKKIMDTPFKQSKNTSNFLKIEKKYNEDGTPKKDAITILTKKQICDEVDRGTKYKDICAKFNLKNLSNVTRIYKEKDRWIDEFNKDSSPFRKTTKTTKFPNIENGLKNFIANANKAGVTASQFAIQERGKELAEAAGVKFSMSDGFVQRFRKRNETIIQKNEIIKNFNDLKKYAAQSKVENLTSNMLSTINKLEKLIYNESKEMVQNTLEKH